jgi:hypothetical protein
MQKCVWRVRIVHDTARRVYDTPFSSFQLLKYRTIVHLFKVVRIPQSYPYGTKQFYHNINVSLKINRINLENQ